MEPDDKVTHIAGGSLAIGAGWGEMYVGHHGRKVISILAHLPPGLPIKPATEPSYDPKSKEPIKLADYRMRRRNRD